MFPKVNKLALQLVAVRHGACAGFHVWPFPSPSLQCNRNILRYRPCSFLWGTTAVEAHRQGFLMPSDGAASAADVRQRRKRLLESAMPVDARRAALAAVAPGHPAAHDPSVVLPFALQVRFNCLSFSCLFAVQRLPALPWLGSSRCNNTAASRRDS